MVMVEASEVDLRRMMTSEVSTGRQSRSACGSVMRRRMVNGPHAHRDRRLDLPLGHGEDGAADHLGVVGRLIERQREHRVPEAIAQIGPQEGMADEGARQHLPEAVVDQVELNQERRAAEGEGERLGRPGHQPTAVDHGDGRGRAHQQAEDDAGHRQEQRQRHGGDQRWQERDDVDERLHQRKPREKRRSSRAMM